MRKRFTLSVVSIGLLVACGPHDVDLGGGSGGDGTSTGGVGGGYAVGGAGGSYATGGSGGVTGTDCGDGVVQAPELCDDAGEIGGCPSNCGLVGDTGGSTSTGGGPAEGVCGDGIVEPGEICDDGNTLGGDGCSSDCLGEDGGAGGSDGSGGYGGTGGVGVGGGPAEAVCGDGIIEPGEICDDGNTLGGDGCSSDCMGEDGGTGGTGGTGMGVGGGPATGGTVGMAGMAGNTQCTTEIVEDPEECSDNDVFLGRAYERCMTLDRALVAVRFLDPCSDHSSHSIEIDCCVRAGSGTGGTGGTGSGNAGSSTGGTGGTGGTG